MTTLKYQKIYERLLSRTTRNSEDRTVFIMKDRRVAVVEGCYVERGKSFFTQGACLIYGKRMLS